MNERFEARAKAMAENAVGKEFRIRLERSTASRSGHVIFGTIVRCEYIGVRERSASAIARFRVWIGNHEPVVVTALPR